MKPLDAVCLAFLVLAILLVVGCSSTEVATLPAQEPTRNTRTDTLAVPAPPPLDRARLDVTLPARVDVYDAATDGPTTRVERIEVDAERGTVTVRSNEGAQEWRLPTWGETLTLEADSTGEADSSAAPRLRGYLEGQPRPHAVEVDKPREETFNLRRFVKQSVAAGVVLLVFVVVVGVWQFIRSFRIS